MELSFKIKEKIDVISLGFMIEYLNNKYGHEYKLKKNVLFESTKNSKKEYKNYITYIDNIEVVKEDKDINNCIEIEREGDFPIIINLNKNAFYDEIFEVQLVQEYPDLIYARNFDFSKFSYGDILPHVFPLELEKNIKIDLKKDLSKLPEINNHLSNLLEYQVDGIVDYTDKVYKRRINDEMISVEINNIGKINVSMFDILDYEDFTFIRKKIVEGRYVTIIVSKKNEKK